MLLQKSGPRRLALLQRHCQPVTTFVVPQYRQFDVVISTPLSFTALHWPQTPPYNVYERERNLLGPNEKTSVMPSFLQEGFGRPLGNQWPPLLFGLGPVDLRVQAFAGVTGPTGTPRDRSGAEGLLAQLTSPRAHRTLRFRRTPSPRARSTHSCRLSASCRKERKLCHNSL